MRGKCSTEHSDQLRTCRSAGRARMAASARAKSLAERSARTSRYASHSASELTYRDSEHNQISEAERNAAFNEYIISSMVENIIHLKTISKTMEKNFHLWEWIVLEFVNSRGNNLDNQYLKRQLVKKINRQMKQTVWQMKKFVCPENRTLEIALVDKQVNEFETNWKIE